MDQARRGGSKGPGVPKFGSFRAGIIWMGLAAAVVLDLVGGCGKVGSPIPPEDVGIAAKLEQERQEQAKRDKKEAEREEELELPPLRPFGTR